MSLRNSVEMTSRVTFYQLNEPAYQGKLRLTCNLVSTAFNRGHKVYLSAISEDQCKLLNDLLWTFSPSAFIPHTLLLNQNATILEKFPVLIGCVAPPEWLNDVLVSLHDSVPDYAQQFEIIAEPVDVSNRDVELASRRVETYFALTGAQPTTHFV